MIIGHGAFAASALAGSAVGAATSAATATAAGIATAQAVGDVVAAGSAVGIAAGIATAQAVGASTAASVASASGIATAQAVGIDANAPVIEPPVIDPGLTNRSGAYAAGTRRAPYQLLREGRRPEIDAAAERRRLIAADDEAIMALIQGLFDAGVFDEEEVSA